MLTELLMRSKEIHPADRAAWLAGRRDSLGSSDAAAAVGVSPWSTPIDLWCLKTGQVPPVVETEAMRWGSLLEPLIAAEYQRATGHQLAFQQLHVTHTELPWATATLDGITSAGRIVEVKTASGFSQEWGEPGTDQVPEHYLIQVHHQLMVAGCEVADVAVLFDGRRFEVYTVERQEALIRAVETTEKLFWEHVQQRTPPTWGRVTAGTLAVLNPECAGEVVLGEGAQLAVENYEFLSSWLKEREAEKAELQTAILSAMGNHQFGLLPDGRRIKRFRSEVPEKEVAAYTRKAYTSHYFRIIKERDS